MKMHKTLLTSFFAILFLLAHAHPEALTGEDAFTPPHSYLEIKFPEYGGGPVQLYTANEFSSITELVKTRAGRVIWVTSNPPTTATKTVVAGLFALTQKNGKWEISDAKRFEADGKYSNAEAYCTGSATLDTQTPLHITVTLHQGGHGQAFEESASYEVNNDGKLVLAIPKETQGEH